VLRYYGKRRDLCSGPGAVLPDGQIWNGLTRAREETTGYDCVICWSAEARLGVITAAAPETLSAYGQDGKRAAGRELSGGPR